MNQVLRLQECVPGLLLPGLFREQADAGIS